MSDDNAPESDRSCRGIPNIFPMFSFRLLGAVFLGLRGDGFSTIMQRAFNKEKKINAWRQIHLAEVVSPGSSGYSMMPAATEAPYDATNDFPVSLQSRPCSWLASGMNQR